MIGIYTFKAGKGLKVDNEGYLVAAAIAFWIMSFFKKSYESALEGFHSYSVVEARLLRFLKPCFSTEVKIVKLAAIMGTLCSVYTSELNLQYDSDFIQDMIFIFVPTVIYMHSVTLTTYPFVSHHKRE